MFWLSGNSLDGLSRTDGKSFFFLNAVIRSPCSLASAKGGDHFAAGLDSNYLIPSRPTPACVILTPAGGSLAPAKGRQDLPLEGGQSLFSLTAYSCTISANWEILRTAHPYGAGSE